MARQDAKVKNLQRSKRNGLIISVILSFFVILLSSSFVLRYVYQGASYVATTDTDVAAVYKAAIGYTPFVTGVEEAEEEEVTDEETTTDTVPETESTPESGSTPETETTDDNADSYTDGTGIYTDNSGITVDGNITGGESS